MEQQLSMEQILLEDSVNRILHLNNLLNKHKISGSITGKAIGSNVELNTNVITISAELAEYLLKHHNGKNRPLNKTNVKTLSNEMLSGRWKFDGEPIRFDNEANLIDGQHRLAALIEAAKVREGFVLQFLVVTGLGSDSFLVMDTGRKRTGGDTLATAGVQYFTTAASTCKFIYAFREGRFSANRNHNRTLTNSSLPEYYDSLETDNLKISDSIQFGTKIYTTASTKLLSKTDIAGFHYVFSEIDKKDADTFITQVILGIGLTPNSPALAIRDKLIKKKTDTSFKFSNMEMIKSMVHCWNKFREGKEVKQLRLPENFEIILK